jgi:hypothetical protein
MADSTTTMLDHNHVPEQVLVGGELIADLAGTLPIQWIAHRKIDLPSGPLWLQ